ncbi:DUF3617 family protein [Caulobacter sp. 73W]|uniref:DUF3617 family protein n=1 Tax=Caulobacter sp. 73W TaxID=3161137 RepID=A0AB39KU84_9CAUL
MRKFLILSASLVVLAGCGKSAEKTETSEAAAVEGGKTPELTALGRIKVRPGLWESNVTGDDEPVRSQACIGDDGLLVGPEDMPENPACRPTVKTYPGGVRLTSDCTQNDIRMQIDMNYRISDTSASGDLNMTITPKDQPADTSTLRMTSKWVAAACPADLPAGDMKVLD